MRADALQQRRGEASGHEEAHQLSAGPLGNVDAYHLSVGAHGRTAAHARIERAGEMHALVIGVLDQAVVGAFDDGEAEIERVAHREQALAFGQAGRLSCDEFEEPSVALVEPHDGEVVGEIDGKQLDPAATAVGGGVFQQIGLGLERDLRDDMIIGDGEAVGTNQKPRADRGLPSRPGDDRSDLQQPRRRGGKDLLGRRRSGNGRLAGNGESHADPRKGGGETNGGAQKLPHGRPFSPSSAGWEGSPGPPVGER